MQDRSKITKQNIVLRRYTRFAPGVVILLVVLLTGSIGYYLLEGLTLLQSFFTSLLVISTLGLVRQPETAGGTLLTMGLIVTGVGTLFYLLSEVAEVIIEGSLGSGQERRMRNNIARMHRHSIICGYGRVGAHAAGALASEQRPFVLIDNNPEVVERARADGYTAILGDATEDHVLKAAGMERADCLLITTASDAINVFITLSARAFNPKLTIVARATEDSSEAKLIKAGANHVIAPETIGGRRMAALAMRPDAADVVDSLIGSQDDSGWLDQTTVEPGSSLAGVRIRDARIYNETGATIIAIRRKDRRTVLNPSGDEYIREGDVLISIGARDEITQLDDMTSTPVGGREQQ